MRLQGRWPAAPSGERLITHRLQSSHAGITVHINEQNIADVHADIEGPAGTPYAGGLFKMRLVLGADFPGAPPAGFFTTKIFHPNVSKTGEICVNVSADYFGITVARLALVTSSHPCFLGPPHACSTTNSACNLLCMSDSSPNVLRASKVQSAQRAHHATATHLRRFSSATGALTPACGTCSWSSAACSSSLSPTRPSTRRFAAGYCCWLLCSHVLYAP